MNTVLFARVSGFVLLAVLAIGSLVVSHDAVAKVGVGMGAGEIRLDEPVKAGGIYELPELRVFNTGDEVTIYGMGVAYHQDNPQLRPAQEWFGFSPETFTINPNESQAVRVSMIVPLQAEPGEYFAFIESGPIANGEPGTSVGVAVGTKLFFTVVPSNFLQASLYRVSSLYETYAPWSWVGTGIVGLIIIGFLFRRFFSFSISVRKDS